MSRPYTEARARNNKAYDAKTYKKYTILLRNEDDAEIIKSLEQAKASGKSAREWLNELWDKRSDV